MDQLDRTVPQGRLVARRTVLEMGCGLVGLGLLAACSDDEEHAKVPHPTPTTWAAPAEPLRFPAGFVWGSATAAFQVEGSTTADGRGALDLGHVRRAARPHRRRLDR